MCLIVIDQNLEPDLIKSNPNPTHFVDQIYRLC